MDDIKLFENWFKSTKWFTGYNCTPKYITYRSMLQAWQASAQREGYKLVPVEKVMDCLYQISDRSYVDDNVSEIKAMIGACE